jgi:hypothetical protein
VCHGTAIVIDARSLPVRIHGILDEASRYVIALEAFHHERESEMLALLVRAVRKHGPADALYLDNGATYRGHALSLACARMGTTLIHAKPYDAPARGKMERFWRTLREGCLDHTGSLGSLHDLNVRLWAFIDQHYHRAPHGGLLGKSPQSVYEASPRPVDGFDEQKAAPSADHSRAPPRAARQHAADGWHRLENRLALPRWKARHRLALPHRSERVPLDRARRPRPCAASCQPQEKRAL